MRDKLIAILKQQSQHMAVQEMTVELLAQLANVSVENVLQTLGSAENYPALLAYEQPNITRDRILSAAMAVFAQKGWQKTSLDEVAAAAGMTKGAIYWHFRNKNDLFFALLDARLQRDTSPLTAEIQYAIQQAQQGQAQAAVMHLFAQSWSRCAVDREWLRLYLEVMSQAQEPEISQRLQGLYHYIWQLSAEFVEGMQAGGLVRQQVNPQDMAVLWCVIFDGVMAAATANPHLDIKQLAQQIIPILWQGIAPSAQGQL
ncbi:TetR/AcrR family transcriptional regulator [Agitococcus lubricus]|uniref:TetR family transcriptional regulator n=1 Tax=Agitococcus lubricus TaxID=1077255 RepID=A0A2T5IWX7_9GAMM|nr:TetR/AcrR family transcriptional regulator [Agitococcus lubricus]PTQ88429.1 TetR family transcriptional regulator [Agitococcus lubricus]